MNWILGARGTHARRYSTPTKHALTSKGSRKNVPLAVVQSEQEFDNFRSPKKILD